MQKLGLITTLILMMVAAAHAGAQALFGRLASTPVQQFNQQIRQASSSQQGWVNDYREVARRFVGHEDVPTRIHAQQLDNDLVLSVALDGQKSDMLYILTLAAPAHLGLTHLPQVVAAKQGQETFTPVPCP